MGNELTHIASEGIQSLIHTVRGQRVMLDSDLARLFGVPTKRLLEQYKRNRERFPRDFAFQLESEELAILRSQFATSSSHGGPAVEAPKREIGFHLREVAPPYRINVHRRR